MRISSLRSLALATLAAGTLVACSDSTKPLAGTGQSMSLSFAGVRPAGVSGVMGVQSVLGDTLVQVSGTDTLKITDVALVMRRISLKRVEDSGVDCDTMPETAENACERFTLRDVLVHLPLTQGVVTSFAIPVDSGQYSSVEFKIHRPGSDSIDLAFIAANPGFDTVSVRVTGLFNGVPFTFVSRLDGKQKFEFNPPLVVDASGTPTNLTIRLDITTWFMNGGSGSLIDPTTANPGGANESLVNENIKNSIKAFKDRDRDDDERNG